MKRIENIIVVIVIALFVFNCKNNTSPEIKTVETAIINTSTSSTTGKVDPNAKYAKAEFTVEGMTCAIGCAATIQKKIAKMDGVKYVKVDFEKKLAMVEYDEAQVTPTLLEKTVTDVADSYKVTDIKTVNAFSVK